VSGYLLDTNVISELAKVQPEAKVISWIQASSEELLYLSVLTIGEIRKGIDSLPRSNKRALLESWLANDLVLRFAGRMLDVSLDIAERWGLIST
jgi:predicted nucleic acid-binding protein